MNEGQTTRKIHSPPLLRQHNHDHSPVFYSSAQHPRSTHTLRFYLPPPPSRTLLSYPKPHRNNLHYPPKPERLGAQSLDRTDKSPPTSPQHNPAHPQQFPTLHQGAIC